MQHLAAVQSLVIYQIIRLFDPDMHLCQSAEKDNSLLEIWSAHLWKRSFTDPPSFHSPYEKYVFNESLRRTIIMSVFTRCAWSVLTKGGLADQVPVLARLPFYNDLEAWRCMPAEWERRYEGVVDEEEEGLVTYGEWAVQWDGQRDVELDPFGRLLLATCLGKQDPRLLVEDLG